MTVPAAILTPGTNVEVSLPYLGDPEDGFAPEWYVYGEVLATGVDSVIVTTSEVSYANGDESVITVVSEVLLTKVERVFDRNGATAWEPLAA